MDQPLRQTPKGERCSPAAALLAWYDRQRRDLPWRAKPGETADPYLVWLSEIMLQQTTVTAVKPYFDAFRRRWPDVAALAAAPVEAVMQQWAGLGYYARARNLHACAKAVVVWYGGQFPATEAELRQLPGIGPYTAGAVAAIAFGRQAVAVDGNVERVIARLYAIDTPLPAAKPLIAAHARSLLDPERPGDFAQAMMDLGATICTPRRPLCGLCPLNTFCLAAARLSPEDWPRKAAKAARPARRGAAFFLRRGAELLLRTRPPQGLLGGMSEFPGTEWSADYDPTNALRDAPLIADYHRLDVTVMHQFTHFILTLDIFVADGRRGTKPPQGCRWVSDIEAEALPSVMRKVVAAVRSSGWWERA
ncbi:A/G-specific adenine glycosylase [Methylovirgula ligni]|uniref:Adenine DNA glycosylase n=1 Tax=Methylovirgula ligni TaxID=569860 RepID=A0A3D9YUT8_9HYPH|nr:A/G-specific adenine glycosylase [Methylovirgula ligni]QAY95956.1 A/G-specific adenine glycosylase [Methylovirgula ligni]REF86377.1 A/G-specific DNA-adenine glycosylase [Methylovirgula ligni]